MSTSRLNPESRSLSGDQAVPRPSAALKAPWVSSGRRMADGHKAAEKWMLVLPPEGGARMVGLQMRHAMERQLGADALVLFDCRTYEQGFRKMLSNSHPELHVDLLNQSLVIRALDADATHVLVMALAPVTRFSLGLLHKVGMQTVHWFLEDYRVAEYWRDVLPGYDLFCGVQRGRLEEEALRRDIPFLYLPSAASHFADAGKPWEDRPHELGFLGIPTPYRIRILERLKEAGFKLALAGEGWRTYQGSLRTSIRWGDWIDGKEAADFLGSVKIGLNLAVSEELADEDQQVSPRIWDLLGSGCVVLSERFPLLESTWTGPGLETFRSAEEAIGKAERLLRSPPRDEHLKETLRQVGADHNYDARFESIRSALAKSTAAPPH